MLTLIHYGRAGLSELNPRFHGMGYPDAASYRKANAEPGTWINRTYYYVDGSRTEKRVTTSSRQKYIIQFPLSRIYDVNKDANNLWNINSNDQSLKIGRAHV